MQNATDNANGVSRAVGGADARQVAERYLAAWNDRDAASRRARVLNLFAPDAQYRDPSMAGSGHAGIDALIAGAQDHFPGHAFTLRGTPEGHHDVVRFSWTLGVPGAVPVAHGSDIVVLAGDGSVAGVAGFLDRVV